MRFYRTITEAISGLKSRGYTIDFNLGFGGVQPRRALFSLASDKFEITEVYRFEGDSSSDDAAVVYAIESHDGIKGSLVNGFGISADSASDEIVKDLSIRY